MLCDKEIRNDQDKAETEVASSECLKKIQGGVEGEDVFEVLAGIECQYCDILAYQDHYDTEDERVHSKHHAEPELVQ